MEPKAEQILDTKSTEWVANPAAGSPRANIPGCSGTSGYLGTCHRFPGGATEMQISRPGRQSPDPALNLTTCAELGSGCTLPFSISQWSPKKLQSAPLSLTVLLRLKTPSRRRSALSWTMPPSPRYKKSPRNLNLSLKLNLKLKMKSQRNNGKMTGTSEGALLPSRKSKWLSHSLSILSSFHTSLLVLGISLCPQARSPKLPR